MEGDDEDNDQALPFIIKDADDSNEQKGRSSHRKCLSSRSLYVAVAGGLTILLFFGAIAASTFHSQLLGALSTHQHPRILVKPCGESPEAARQKGCHFDVISFCWLPDACYDAELSAEFDQANRLEWFLDANRTQPLSHSQIMTGEHTGLYVDWEYHLTHCTAMWKKMHRAVLGDLGRGAIDGYIGVYEHTKHCEAMLLSDRSIELDVINTRIAVKYPNCGI